MLIKLIYNVAVKSVALSFLPLLVLFVTSNVATALADCKISRPFMSAPVEDFLKAEECGVKQIIEANTFRPGDGAKFLARAAYFYPQSNLILSFEKEFQDQGEPLAILKATKSIQNYDLTLALSEIHFSRAMIKTVADSVMMTQVFHGLRAEEAHQEIKEVLGEKVALRVLNDLLKSDNETVITNVTKAISQIPEGMNNKLKLKTKTPLMKLANNGNPYALEALYWNHDRFIDPRLLAKLEVSNIDNLSPHYASQAFQALIVSRPYQNTDSSLKRFFLHSASGDIDTHVLARILETITGDSQFKVKFKGKPNGERTDFEKCGINEEKDIFSCFSLIKEDEKELGKYHYYLLPSGLLFKHFKISYSSKISKVLIDGFFAADLAFELKTAFADTFFNTGLIKNSQSHVQLMRRIKADVNQFMWSKYPKDIVTANSYRAFPLVDEFIYPNLTQLLMSPKQYNTVLKKHTHTEAFIPHLASASSESIFKNLSLSMYALYMHLPPEQLEAFIDKVLKKVTNLFGKKSEMYFDFAYHKFLISTQTNTIEPTSFLIENIRQMKIEGFDTSLWEDQLIETYMKMEKFDYVEKHFKQELEALVTKKLELANAGPDQQALAPIMIDMKQCGIAKSLRIIQQRKNDVTNFSDEFKHCFNDFDYPSKVPIMIQHEIFGEYVSRDITTLFSNGPANKPDKMFWYITELLADKTVPKFFKAPFAFMLFISTEDRDAQQKIIDQYLNIKVLGAYPEIMSKEIETQFEWYQSLSESLLEGNQKAAAINTIEIMKKGSQPDFQSPISAVDSKVTALNFPIIFIKELIDLSNSSSQVMQDLYVVQQNLKFGPSEQLVLRSSLLSGQNLQKFQTLITQRNLIVESLIEAPVTNEDTTALEAKLIMQNEELYSLEYPEISWPKIYPNLSSLSKTFDKNTLYLDFRHDKAGDSIGLFSVTKHKVSFDVIQNADQIAAIVSTFRSKLKDGGKAFFKEGQLLYKKILEPYLTPNINKILISPHSFLYDVPFSALVITNEGSSVTSPSSGGATRGLKVKDTTPSQIGTNTYVGEVFDVSLVSTVVKKVRSFSSPEYTFFGIGNPNFSGKKSNTLLSFNIFQNEPSRSGASISTLPALPETGKELRLFAKLPLFTRSKVFTGDDASIFSLTDNQFLENASVIHFATHGLTAGKITQYSEPGLALTPSLTEGKKSDGFLSMTDVLSLKLNAELVILSACDTGSSLSLHSPPLSGLTSAFLAAGSQKVLATRWPVSDQATKLFITMVGTEKTKENSWNSAKRQATKKFIRKYPQYSHPNFWAPFVIYETLE